ncbi:MAG: hypothetical protein KDK34_03765, partial [Leptospiraceae bacterium]|nr:hypothetical protein [Leptospiraceae bacterium]
VIAAYQKRFANRPEAESTGEDFDHDTQGAHGGKTAEASGLVETESATGREWLGEIILSAIPWPLYCQDLQGNTLFYNRAFERDVLAREKLKNSIRLAEAFLLELTRSALALAYAEDREQESEAGTLTTTSQALDLIIRISYLQKNDRIVGYLYVFQEPGDDNLVPDLINRMVENEEGLEEITDDLEARLIYHMLARHGQNISHTARALRIKRSTLQNKMKRLRLDERFHRQIEGPIRRHRRTREELEAEAARSSDPSPDSADRFLTAYESDSATGESGPEWNRSHESRVNTTAIRADHPDIVSRSETSDQRIGMSEFVSELSQNRRSTGGADQRDSTARSHAHGAKKTGRTSKAIRKTASKPAPKSSAARKASGRTAKQTAAGRKAEKQSAHKKKSVAGTRKKSVRNASRKAAAKSTAKAASGKRTGKKASKKKTVRKQGRPKSVAAHSNRRR